MREILESVWNASPSAIMTGVDEIIKASMIISVTILVLIIIIAIALEKYANY
jgi:hypothetical protein